jgi:hypothetical protein
MTPHLTSPNMVIDELAARTVQGMAHWAGSGPKMMTCRLCVFWQMQGYYAGGKGLKPGPCRKYSTMMRGAVGGRIPHDTSACKYFEENQNAPGAFPK